MKGKPGVITLYGFSLLLLYLAGAYFGTFLLNLFYLLLFFPLLSLMLTLWPKAHISVSQKFSNREPIRGEHTLYRLRITNESFLPVYNMALELHGSERQTFFLKPLEQLEKQYTLKFQHRGIYGLGLTKIELNDFLHLFSLSGTALTETFYIYPAVHRIETFPVYTRLSSGKPGRGLHKEGVRGTSSPSFSHLRECRNGEPLRHISWKKFAGLGIPLVVESGSGHPTGVLIYLDLRAPLAEGETRLAIKDTSIEVLIALTRFFWTGGFVGIIAPGEEVLSFYLRRRDQFSHFYKSTPNLLFRKSSSPVLLINSGSRIPMQFLQFL